MPNYSLEALVLAKTKLGDSDLIFTLLGEDGAQVRAVAKGVRKPRSRLRGTLEVFARLSLLLGKGRNLDVVAEARVTDMHAGCRSSFERICAGEVICEAASKVSYPDHPQRNLFAMTDTALSVIEHAPTDHLTLLVDAFLLKVVSLVGYRPELTCCARCGSSLEEGREDDELVPFSVDMGGCLCARCRTSCEPRLVPRATIQWMQALLGMRFSELSETEHDTRTDAMLLDLANRWFEDHVGSRLKSLRYLQM
jgi:DNA repair protein RecO (recombination protein O)